MCVGRVLPGKIRVNLPTGRKQALENWFDAACDKNGFAIRDGVLLCYSGEAQSVLVPEGVTAIENGAFAGCGKLAAVTLPSSVVRIGASAFEGCTALRDITIPLACVDRPDMGGNKAVTAAVFSDTHGDISRLYQIKQQLPPIQLLLHLGDLAPDGEEMASALGVPGYAVAGNCDGFTRDWPQERVITLGGIRVLMVHGQRYFGSVAALGQDALQKGCAVALMGHSHRPLLAWQDRCLILNPGSLNFPRGGMDAGYALLTLQGECLHAQLHTI